jgi:gliding motility-associated-like protein
MKTSVFKYIYVLLLLSLNLFINVNSKAQCTNAGFESGNFNGWGGTFSQSTSLPQGGGTNTCQTGTGPGTCLTGTGPCTTVDAATGCFIPCVAVPCVSVITGIFPDPFRHIGFSTGTANQAANATPENSHFIMSSGFDAMVGNALPVVNPNGGGNYSARLGNAQQSGGGESMMYKLAVDSNNSSFTYSYAVVLDGGNHNQWEQPFFKIQMFVYGTAGDSTEISCAAYDVNGISAPNIGGFQTTNGVQWKNWSSVTIPLDNYIGKTVAIQFITRDCCPGCTSTNSQNAAGSHFAYAYIDASCDPLKVIPSAPAVCAGTNVTLTAPSAKTYSWTGPGIVSGATSQVVTVNQPGKYTVVMSTLSNSACSFTLTATMPGSLVGGANVTVNSVKTCIGGSAILTASGGASYSWAPGGQTTTSYTAPTATAGTTTYTVTGKGATCGSDTAIATVIVSPVQNATFSYNPATVCKAGGTNPQPVLAGTPGGTFSCPADGSLVINPNSGVIDLSLTPLGTYTVTYSLAAPCPAQSTSVINIVSVPKADFTLGIYCQNDPNPSPAFVNGGSAGVFSSTAGLVFKSTTTGEINLAASTIGTYTVTNSINSPGCPPVSATSTITIKPFPIVTVNNQTVCTGSSTTLKASGAATYVWSDASNADTLKNSPPSTQSYTVTGTTAGCSSSKVGTITVNSYPIVTVNNPTICAGAAPTKLTASGAATYLWSTGASINNVTVSPASTTVYTITGTSKSCSTKAIATITVNPLPVIAVNSPAICQGLSGVLAPSGGSSYKWSDNTYISNKNITPVATKTYTVYGSTANCTGLPTSTPAEVNAYLTCWSGGCTSSAISTVTLINKPIIIVNSPTICIGETTTLLATGGATYDWSTGAKGNTITVTPLTTTSYTVADNTVGCSGSSKSTVTVNPLPVVTVNSQTICAGQSAVLTASGASTYSWSNGAGVNPLIVPLQKTTTFTVTGTSAAGCKNTIITTVTVNPLPIVTSNSTSVCEGLTTKLTASGASTYLWSNGFTTNPVSVSPIKTTNYTVTGTDAKGCTAKAVDTVTVFPKPGTDFSITPQPAFVTFPNISFIDKSSKDVNYWHWDFGDGDTLGNKTPNPVHLYPKVEATYTVTLSVLNGGLCPNSVTHEVVIGPEYSFFIPNAFTPDGDFINDTFFGKGKGIIKFELMVFDRWGNFIFYADDIDKGWDGKANGGAETAQQDVYVWKVNLVDVFKKKHSFIGTVTLIKGQ